MKKPASVRPLLDKKWDDVFPAPGLHEMANLGAHIGRLGAPPGTDDDEEPGSVQIVGKPLSQPGMRPQIQLVPEYPESPRQENPVPAPRLLREIVHRNAAAFQFPLKPAGPLFIGPSALVADERVKLILAVYWILPNAFVRLHRQLLRFLWYS